MSAAVVPVDEGKRYLWWCHLQPLQPNLLEKNSPPRVRGLTYGCSMLSRGKRHSLRLCQSQETPSEVEVCPFVGSFEIVRAMNKEKKKKKNSTEPKAGLAVAMSQVSARHG